MTQELITLQLRELANNLRARGYTQEQLLALMTGEPSVPVTIFNSQQSPLTSLVNYLSQQGMPLKNISEQTKRSYRAVWGAKTQQVIHAQSTNIHLPLSIFNDHLSILESVVNYLKEEHKLKYSQIARLLGKDQRTIWTIHSRAQKKVSKKKT